MEHSGSPLQLPIGWALLATAVFIAINGFFVVAEFALVKARAARMEAHARRGNLRARAVGAILRRLDLYLSGCQLGITLASLVLGWLAEPAVATLLLRAGEALGLPVADSGLLHGVALALALTVVTVLHMTIGEQAPKILAIQRPEAAAMGIALPLRVFVGIFRPFIWLINLLSNALVHLAGGRGELGHEGAADLDELRAVLRSSSRAGHITARQRALGENVLRLVELEVRHVMVPRTDVVSLSLARSPQENLALVRDSGHTRLPLCEPDLDAVLGLVHGKDLLIALLDGQQTPDLRAMVRPLPTVPDSQPLSRLILDLQRQQQHSALVVDEHGTTVGVVFLEDALEEIVGPLGDEFDELAARWSRPAPDVLELAGNLPLPEAAELLEMQLEHREDSIAGVIIAELGRIPREGEQLDLPPYRVTVLNVARRRIGRLRFEPSGGGGSPVQEEAPNTDSASST